jgi:protein-disulfide isomerase
MGYDKKGGRDEDVLVLNKWVVITAVVAVLIFALGGAAGYFVARFSFDQAMEAQAAQQPSIPPVQPTQGPVRLDNVETDGDPQIGPNNAKVTIVEFSDFQCPYCQRFRNDTFDALFEAYGDDIRFVYRDFPLSSLHPQAQKAAEAAECANDQGKFWEMHDLLYENIAILSEDLYLELADELKLDTEQFADCLDSDKYADEVAADQQDGASYGVSGTPTFFINGWKLVGAQPFTAFEALIEQELDS